MTNQGGLRAWLCAASLAVLPAACGNTAPEAAPTSANGEVVATVNGTAITTGELETALGARLASLEEQVYTLKREQLDAMIAERLLAAEAARRGISVEALEQQEIAARVEPVTDADIDQFVKANASRLPSDTAALRPRIRAYLENERLESRRGAYVDSLRSAAAVDVRLAPPKIYRAEVGADGFPARGPENAKVTVVEFSDFHCPYCRAVQPTLNALLARYPNDVRLVYRHLPLDQLHPQARRASEASWCADRQGKFWAFHDALYAGGSDASPDTLARLASHAGLDPGVFESCLAGREASAAVQKDVEEAARHGLTGTPGFFVNGRALSGNQPLEAFVAIVEQELGQAR